MNPSLSALVKSSSAEGPPSVTATRDWRSRGAALLPWALLAGFLLLIAVLLGERLIPARHLVIASVVTMRQDAETTGLRTSLPATGDPFESPMLFQASGWVEPEPHPVMATALIDGVIATVEVLEGENVRRGQVLATLIDADARLDLETAESRLAALRAQDAAHHEQLAVVEAEIASLEKQVAAAQARRDETADLADRLARTTSGSVAERDIARARLELATRGAEVEALSITEAELQAKLRQLKEIRNDFSARIAEAETEVDRRQLALDRTRILSPIDGRILRLHHAMPGQKKMLRMDDPHSATIATLYDPARLQARIDVPLAEAARLTVGQPVRIRSELLPDRVFRGRVTRIVGEADLQRNTLQAKVAIENPDDRLRPEMLCRAEFLAPPSAEGGKGTPNGTSATAVETRARVFVPLAALDETDRSSHSAEIWKVDPSGEGVVPQAIVLGNETRNEYRLVLDGLKPGDRVVLDPPSGLVAGDRFRLLSESSTPPES